MNLEIIEEIKKQFDFVGSEKISGYTALKIVQQAIEDCVENSNNKQALCQHEYFDICWCSEDNFPLEFIDRKCRKCGKSVDFC